MKEQPIIFTVPSLIRGIIDGTVTQTRRTRGLEKVNKEPDAWEFKRINNGGIALFWRKNVMEEDIALCKCPYGQVGDQLWVRETWATENRYNHLKPSEIPRTAKIFYLASIDYDPFGMGKKRPSIFMPRWASRITPEITGLRAERLQEILFTDIVHEGINPQGKLPSTVKREFIELWDSLNAKRGYGWDLNPWVWPIEFNAVGIRSK